MIAHASNNWPEAAVFITLIIVFAVFCGWLIWFDQKTR